MADTRNPHNLRSLAGEPTEFFLQDAPAVMTDRAGHTLRPWQVAFATGEQNGPTLESVLSSIDWNNIDLSQPVFSKGQILRAFQEGPDAISAVLDRLTLQEWERILSHPLTERLWELRILTAARSERVGSVHHRFTLDEVQVLLKKAAAGILPHREIERLPRFARLWFHDQPSFEPVNLVPDRAPHFEERKREAVSIKEAALKKVWPFTSGRYAQMSSSDPVGSTSDPRLSPFETELSSQLLQAVLARRRNIEAGMPDIAPVVAIDFGGGYGTSWNIIAHNLFDRSVSGDELCMIVTNLEPFEVAMDIAAHVLPGAEVRSTIETSFQQQRVHYLSGVDAGDLIQTLIPGTDTPLLGNTTLVHEQKSLMHSLISDVDLPLLGMLLKRSAEARLLIGTDLNSSYDESPFPANGRVLVHAKGVENLNKYANIRLAKHDLYAVGAIEDSSDAS